jgi:hypothetical protein
MLTNAEEYLKGAEISEHEDNLGDLEEGEPGSKRKVIAKKKVAEKKQKIGLPEIHVEEAVLVGEAGIEVEEAEVAVEELAMEQLLPLPVQELPVVTMEEPNILVQQLEEVVQQQIFQADFVSILISGYRTFFFNFCFLSFNHNPFLLVTQTATFRLLLSSLPKPSGFQSQFQSQFHHHQKHLRRK